MKVGKNWSSPQGSNKQQQRCFARLLRLEISNRSLIPCLFFVLPLRCLCCSNGSRCYHRSPLPHWDVLFSVPVWHPVRGHTGVTRFHPSSYLFSLNPVLHKLFWGSRENQIRSVYSHMRQTAGEPPVVPQSACLSLHAISCKTSSFVWTLPQCISSQSATAAAMAESTHFRSAKVWGKAAYWQTASSAD